MFFKLADPRITPAYYIAAAIMGAVFLWLGRHRKRTVARTALFVYCFLVIASTVLCRKTTAQVQLIVPGWSLVKIFQTGNLSLKWEVFLNFLMLMPVGILLPLAYEWADGWKTVLLALTFSAGIECAQFILKRGWFEMDDIINNVLGALTGRLIVYAAAYVRGLRRKRD